MTKAALPNTNTSDLLNSVEQAQKSPTNVDPKSMSNVPMGYEIVAKPLEQMIRDVQVALEAAQRSELVKQPNLDDAPPAYRSAVSDYFETMSKNYHPDSGSTENKQP